MQKLLKCIVDLIKDVFLFMCIQLRKDIWLTRTDLPVRIQKIIYLVGFYQIFSSLFHYVS